MISINFSNESNANKIVEMFDFCRGLLDRQEVPSKELQGMIDSINNVKPYLLTGKHIFLRPEETEFLLSNASWVLSSRLEDKDLNDDIKNVYRNSINLMDEVGKIIIGKKTFQTPELDGGRKFYPELQELYSSKIGKNIKFAFDFDIELPVKVPKKDEIWKVTSYKESNPDLILESGPEEDIVTIEKDGIKFEIYPSDLSRLAFFL